MPSAIGRDAVSVSRLPGKRETPHKWGASRSIHTASPPCLCPLMWLAQPHRASPTRRPSEPRCGAGSAVPVCGVFLKFCVVSSCIYSLNLSCFLGADYNMRHISEIMKLIIFGFSRSNLMRLKLYIVFHKGGLMVAHVGLYNISM
jgi:hypothetical protein